jgi:hypothetical protein
MDTPRVIMAVIGRKKTFGDEGDRNEGAMMEFEFLKIMAEIADIKAHMDVLREDLRRMQLKYRNAYIDLASAREVIEHAMLTDGQMPSDKFARNMAGRWINEHLKPNEAL